MFLTKFASKVYIIHRRDQLRAINILRERAKANPKIEFLLDSQVRTINGTDSVESVTVYNKKLDKTREVKVSGIFLYVGLIPNTDFLDSSIKVDEYGYIITNEAMETSVAGVYAAGDIRQKSLRQVVTAVADGAIAAVSANNYLYG